MEAYTQIAVSLLYPESTQSQSAGLTREFMASLDRQRGIEASLPETRGEPGYKGDPQLIGSIILQLAASGGVVVTLVNVLKSYFDRKPSLEFELTRKDGAALKVKAANFDQHQIASFMETLKAFLSID